MHLLKTPTRFKWILSFYPPLWGTGIWVKSVSADFREVVVTMAPHFYNRNAFGAHFGGSLAAMTDPFPTLMLMKVLGADYQIIDSETHIRFLKLARGKVKARFVLDEEFLSEIRTATADGGKHFATLRVAIANEAKEAVVEVEKTIYVRLRREMRPAAES